MVEVISLNKGGLWQTSLPVAKIAQFLNGKSNFVFFNFAVNTNK
jgi:hypothetical protein